MGSPLLLPPAPCPCEPSPWFPPAGATRLKVPEPVAHSHDTEQSHVVSRRRRRTSANHAYVPSAGLSSQIGNPVATISSTEKAWKHASSEFGHAMDISVGVWSNVNVAVAVSARPTPATVTVAVPTTMSNVAVVPAPSRSQVW